MIEYKVKVFEDRTEWYFIGKLHRKDGPAIERADGAKEWYLNGRRHREDGPAIEGADGSQEWYLGGERQSETEFNYRTQITELTVDQLEEILGYRIKVIGDNND